MSMYQRRPIRWAAYALLLFTAVIGFIRIDHESHSASDTLIGVIPLWAVCIAAAFFVRRLGNPRA
jgi:membrane-associated phospholipid phosphatase